MSTVSLLRKNEESEHAQDGPKLPTFDHARIERAVRETLSAVGEDPNRASYADAQHELIIEQRLARPPEQVFPFFADPTNLEKITPSFLHFHILGMTPAQIDNGTMINYALRLHGLPLRWQSRIESWQPNHMFVDVQIRGPYSLWHHTHEFEADGGGTLMRDRVRYRLPFGAFGDLVAGWLVRRDLQAVFDFRRQRIQELVA